MNPKRILHYSSLITSLIPTEEKHWMDTPKRYRSWFIGVTLGILLALCLLPATRWLVLQQAGVTLHTGSRALALLDTATEEETAYRNPDALPVHLAAAMTVTNAT